MAGAGERLLLGVATQGIAAGVTEADLRVPGRRPGAAATGAERVAARVTVQHADRINVVGESGVAEEGRHDELITAGGIYCRLHSSQFGALVLGPTAAKGVLEAALAGYYVRAFGAIRHIADYWFGIEYLDLRPESVAEFYAAEPGEGQATLPNMGKHIREVRTAESPGGEYENDDYERFARLVNRTYKRRSDGHHLGG